MMLHCVPGSNPEVCVAFFSSDHATAILPNHGGLAWGQSIGGIDGPPTCGNYPSREREKEPDKSVYPELHNGRLAQRPI
jgi:hypothetical protein